MTDPAPRPSAGAYGNSVVDAAVSWSSSNAGVATVDPQSGLVRAVTVPARTTARLEFAHLRGGNHGILLDDVKLVRRP